MGDKQQNWYEEGNKYWLNSKATYDGVMSGYGKHSQIDINFSRNFLLKLQNRNLIKFRSVLDCGAGIGRITMELLRHLFTVVDLVDQSSNHINKAKELLKQVTNTRHFYTSGLQNFEFQQKYDCIWIQWVLSQLKDDHAIQFLKKAKLGLNQNGIIIVKQNQSEKQRDIDYQDCSYIRSTGLHRQLFQSAGLNIIEQDLQPDWPQDLYQVKIYALL